MYKEFISAVAILLTLVAFAPYIRAILQRKIRPHVFSWIIWGATTLIVFFAQLADHGGAGAWPIGLSGVLTLYVALLAWQRKADITITRTDWAFFIPAMASLPLWYLASDPLWAVVLLTAIDIVGLAPTFRKAYRHPFDEQLLFFVLIAVRNTMAIAALEHYSLTTILFPASVAMACALFVVMVAIRRKTTEKKT